MIRSTGNVIPAWWGWVFYGLASRPAPRSLAKLWSGSDYRAYPAFHKLVCPHALDKRHYTCDEVAQIGWCNDCFRLQAAAPTITGSQGFMLEQLTTLTRAGLIGLPIRKLTRFSGSAMSIASGTQLTSDEMVASEQDSESVLGILDRVAATLGRTSGDRDEDNEGTPPIAVVLAEDMGE